MTTFPPSSYKAIILGSGQAGTPLASAFSRAGHKTLLVESVHIGGCCVNEGCTPTKTLITSGRVAYLARRGQDYGVVTGDGGNEVKINMLKVRERKREIVKSFRGGNETRLEGAGVEVLMGKASFASATKVKIQLLNGEEKIVEGEKIFINVGERPASPVLAGLEGVAKERVLDSTSIQELDTVPEHLIVVGGGYVGVEFAQLFRRLGAKVTILQRAAQLLPREDPEIADALLKILEEDGVDIKLSSTPLNISSSPSGFSLKVNNTEPSIQGSHILFASGRVPNSDSLNLEAAGISTNEKGYIVVDEYLTTSIPHIFALGDVKGPPAFTHISYDDFRLIQTNHLSPSPATKRSTKNRIVPYVVYTDPQLGHVGLHEAEARSMFPERRIKTAKMPMEYVARALETEESRGLMKAVVDGETGEILGFTCLGIEGGEVMNVVQMAIMGGVKYQVLQDAVWAHPSLGESLNNLWGFLE